MRCARSTAPSATSACAPTATTQYVEVAGEFAHYLDDPYVEPGFTRAPLHDEVEVVVIGGGFGGLLAGARLREAGIDDIRIIEKGGDFGGTWYWNRYPGATCDIESLHLSAAARRDSATSRREKYAHAPEILAHSRAHRPSTSTSTATRCFQTEVTEMRWDEAAARWIVSTESRRPHARALRRAWRTGRCNRPKLPGIPGIETFKGHTFHTSRWDYALHRRRQPTAI